MIRMAGEALIPVRRRAEKMVCPPAGTLKRRTARREKIEATTSS
jgi:hypothetical protein